MQSRLQDSVTEVRLGTFDIVVISRGRRRNPYTRCARTAAPLAHPTASSARSQPPTGSNFVRLLENVAFPPRRSAGRSRLSLTESALRVVGPDQDLGRRRPELRHPPGCAAGVRCRLRYGPAGRRRSPQRVRDRRGARNPCRQGIWPDRSCTRSPRALSGTLPRVTGIDLDGIYTNTNSHSASHSGSTADAVVTGRRARVPDLMSQATVIPRGSMVERKSRRNQLDFVSAAVAA